MKYGMPTLVECKDIYECAAACKKYGLDFVEINMSFPQYQADALDIESVKKLASEYGIFYTIHADEQMNPFDFNKSVSECYFNNMKECIRMAKALDIPIINMHLLKGVYVTLPGKVILLSDVYIEKYLDSVRSFISMCEEEIGNSDLKICIENVDSNPFTSSQVRALELFMSSPAFALTLDVGHMECLSGKDSYVFEKYPDKLYHMHLHDSDGKSCHLALGDGGVDILSKIEKLKGNTCLVEVKTLDGLGTSTEYLQKHGLMKAD